MAERLAQTVSAYLDTHVAVWLHDGLLERLSTQAKRHIDAHDLLLSPMVLLELQYLYDRKRISVRPGDLTGYLSATFDVEICGYPFEAVIRESLPLHWTSDPFDRIIVAQAKANHDSLLLTADATIRRHYARAAW
jgi:PIN domain nuclease of toxin-antitoxin system